jgi:hypothetical protein
MIYPWASTRDDAYFEYSLFNLFFENLFQFFLLLLNIIIEIKFTIYNLIKIQKNIYINN